MFKTLLLFVFTAPSAPDNFTAELIETRQVTFSWLTPRMPNGNINGYNLTYSNSTHNIVTLPLIIAGPDPLNITVENLNEFTDYRFELRARTIAGFGPPAVLNLTTDQAGILRLLHLLMTIKIIL